MARVETTISNDDATVAAAVKSHSLTFRVAEGLADVLGTMGLELLFCLVAIGLAGLFRTFRRKAYPAPRSEARLAAYAGGKLAKALPARGAFANLGARAQAREGAEADAAASAAGRGSRGPLPLDQLAERAIAMRIPTTTALAQYSERRLAGQHFKFAAELARLGSKHTAFDFYAALVQCAGRAGRPQLVIELLDDMAAVGIARTLPLYESAMKLLAGKKCFREALLVYDRLSADAMEPSPITFSCLVGFAAELGEADRAIDFFERLAAREVPSIRAYMTVFRVYSQRKDWLSSQRLLCSMHARGAEVDTLAMNMVLATGVSAGKVDEAAALLSEASWRAVADVVSYNIILKGFAQQGKALKALAMLEAMSSSGVVPNLISFNTAIDASARGLRSEDAWRLYKSLREERGMKPDKCTCSTLVKTLQQEATPMRVAAVLDLLEEVLHECSADLAGRLLAGTLEAALELEALALSVRAFALRERLGGASDLERLGLAIMAAKAGDADACAAAWRRAGQSREAVAGDLAELASVKAAVAADVANGGELCAATLRALAGPAALAAKRTAEREAAATAPQTRWASRRGRP